MALALAVMNTTTSAIFRLLAEEQVTILFDEVDAIFGSKIGNYEVFVRSSMPAIVAEPYALASWARGSACGPRNSRCSLQPRLRPSATSRHHRVQGDHVRCADALRAKRWNRSAIAELFTGFGNLRDRLAAWAAAVTSELSDADPAMPEQLEDRAADIWEPLLAIADLASDAWAERARTAAIHIVKGRVAEDATSASDFSLTFRPSWPTTTGCRALPSVRLSMRLLKSGVGRMERWQGDQPARRCETTQELRRGVEGDEAA